MGIEVKLLTPEDAPFWDAYVQAHPQATLYHLSGWRNVINKTYGHKTYYLFAAIDNLQSTIDNPIVGILPLVHLKHFLFGNSLISVPFFDLGGILADDAATEKRLLSSAAELGMGLRVDNIELRHTRPISLLCEDGRSPNARNGGSTSVNSNVGSPLSLELSAVSWTYKVLTHKVRMLLRLPESSDLLMKSFNSKLRSQIRRPGKEGLEARIGGTELLDDFYSVFLVNMRDLGSPVHGVGLFTNALSEFRESAKIVVVYRGDRPVAGSVIVGFRDTLENPWASALREYRRLSPNMLLYWTMLEYACDHGFGAFDFGRSTPGDGTYKFKEQWGAEPSRLHWYHFSCRGQPPDRSGSEESRFGKAIEYWKRLPVPVTRILGPMIRKHIGL